MSSEDFYRKYDVSLSNEDEYYCVYCDQLTPRFHGCLDCKNNDCMLQKDEDIKKIIKLCKRIGDLRYEKMKSKFELSDLQKIVKKRKEIIIKDKTYRFGYGDYVLKSSCPPEYNFDRNFD